MVCSACILENLHPLPIILVPEFAPLTAMVWTESRRSSSGLCFWNSSQLSATHTLSIFILGYFVKNALYAGCCMLLTLPQSKIKI